eukprot:Em0012g858a
MGGSGAKLVSSLKDMKTSEALALWEGCQELKEKFKPNTPIGWKRRDALMHLVTRAGAKDLLRHLLQQGGDPFVTNANDETPIHIVCTSITNDSTAQTERAELLTLLLDKIPEASREEAYEVIPESGSDGSPITYVEDKWNLGVRDKARNTPLHLAAASGLQNCVETLLDHGAPLFARNIAGQTPCEAAAQAKHEDIAKLLECKMVMESTMDKSDLQPTTLERRKASHNTASLQLLQKQIVQGITDALEIAEFPAEALLKAYGWSGDLVTEAWKQDSYAACQKAGLSREMLEGNRRREVSMSLHECEICFESIFPADRIHIPCGHYICQKCLAKYLELQINEGGGREIRCPSSGCYMVVPNDILVAVLSEGLFQRYTDLNIKQFVGSFKDMKWCPYPGCSYAIKLPEGIHNEGGIPRDKTDSPDLGINVVCGRGHWVCWTCLQEAHEPCDCDLWERWKDVISKMEVVDNTVDMRVFQNEKWILGHTKPCPKCNVPIQKTEGCNQVTCKNCGHKFCWLCMDSWGNHSQKTGGSFFCNRYKEKAAAKRLLKESRIYQEEFRRRSMEDVIEAKKRFIHYYNRYQNHLQSIKIEQKLLEESMAKSKSISQTLEILAAKKRFNRCSSADDVTSSDSPSAQCNGNFLEDVMLILLHSRQILSSSYAFGFFIPDAEKKHKKDYEILQGNLEEVVENLSQMVNRPYLCTPRYAMAKTASCVNALCDKYLKSLKRRPSHSEETSSNQ